MTGRDDRDHEHTAAAVGWALHALEPEEERGFAEHLPHCAQCARAVRDTQDLMAQLALSDERDEPPARLREDLVARVAGTAQLPLPARAPDPDPGVEHGVDPAVDPAVEHGVERGERRSGAHRPPTDRDRRAPRRPGRRRSALVAAALVAVVGVGAAGGLLAYRAGSVAGVPVALPSAQAVRAQQERSLLEQVDEPGAAHALLAAPDGRPVAAVLRRDGALRVAVADLTPNDASRSVYVLWGMGGSTAGPVPVGVFDVSPGHHQLMPLGPTPDSGRQFATYALSIEPSRTAPATPTTLVASGALA